MKTITSILIFLFTTNLIGQGLKQSEFDLMNADVKKTLFSIDNSNDLIKLVDKFNLSKNDSTRVENLIQNNKIQYLKSLQGKSFVLPFYFLTDSPKELKLTVFSLTEEPKRKGEDFNRGKYHFILTSTIKIENGNLIYKNSEIIFKQDLINNWFLKGYQSYLDKTGLVFDKFNYTPPPPPFPPSTLR